jgi:hypothetical protein
MAVRLASDDSIQKLITDAIGPQITDAARSNTGKETGDAGPAAHADSWPLAAHRRNHVRVVRSSGKGSMRGNEIL